MATVAMTITNAGLDLLRAATAGSDSAKITFCAVGTGTTAPTVNDTQLVSEVYRIAVTSTSNGVNHGEILINGFIDLSFANVSIGEVGFFGGNSATSSANTGSLIARGLYAHSKLNTETITFAFDYTL